MAVEIRSFQPTIPAGTAIATPFTFNMSFPPRVVDRIQVKVPSGPRGTVGFAIGSSGVAVIPFQANQWIVADNDDFDWPLDDFWDSGSWTFFGYNLGQFPHTIYVRFLLSLTVAPAPLPASPVPSSALSQPLGSGTTSTGSLVPSPPPEPALPPATVAPVGPITVPSPPV